MPEDRILIPQATYDNLLADKEAALGSLAQREEFLRWCRDTKGTDGTAASLAACTTSELAAWLEKTVAHLGWYTPHSVGQELVARLLAREDEIRAERAAANLQYPEVVVSWRI